MRLWVGQGVTAGVNPGADRGQDRIKPIPKHAIAPRVWRTGMITKIPQAALVLALAQLLIGMDPRETSGNANRTNLKIEISNELGR